MNSFYSSSKWRKLREQLIYKNVVEHNGICVCEVCHKAITEDSKIIAHHVKELNNLNVNDSNISLNPDNIMIVCHDCHNKIHDRWNGGKTKQTVTIVHGAPCSGKSSYVNSIANENDLVVDIDNIWQSIQADKIARYTKPKALKNVVFKVRDVLYDCIKYRIGSWSHCYVIGTLPFKQDRKRLKEKLGADNIVYVSSTIEQCLECCEERPEEWKQYVYEYYEDYEPDD